MLLCRYIPDAEKPDPAKQALPGAVDNSGCSFEFRYLESRHDVSVPALTLTLALALTLTRTRTLGTASRSR